MKVILKKIFFCILSILLSHNLFAQGYICGVGGGSENYNSWSDAPYSWIVQKADSGKVIILGTSSATNWLPDYFTSLGADTAYNKTINSTAVADLQETYDELITARAIFIRGGDQWNYINLWKGTKTDSALNYIFQNGGVISGTSAGLAVLGDVDFSARFGTVYPDESIIDPFNNYMQFEDNFLNLLPDVLFDSHFIERARHGRLIAMLFNRYFTTGRNLIGVGVDDRTAFCITPDGVGEVMGSGAVSIFNIDNETVFEPMSMGDYTIERLKCDQLTRGWKYDLNAREVLYIPPSAKDVDTTRSWDLPQTELWITGSDDISQLLLTSFAHFVANVDQSRFVVISHPGFSGQLTPLINYLDQISAIYNLIYITDSNLNEPGISQTINEATNFVFAGDSLNILSLLKDTSGLAGQSFKQKTIIDKVPVFFFGRSGKIAGQFFTDNLYTDYYAAYRGKMTNNTGLGLFDDLFFEPMLFDQTDFYENRMSSVLWGLMLNRKRFGIYLHDNSMAYITSDENLITGIGNFPPIFIDASQTTKVDSSTFRASGSAGPRQVVAMNNLRYSFTTLQSRAFRLLEGKFYYPASVKNESEPLIGNFRLYQNFPNPFNPVTKIRWKAALAGKQSIRVYDILGNEVMVLFDNNMPEGDYEVEFDIRALSGGRQLSSGVYFYRLLTNNYSETKSMILIK